MQKKGVTFLFRILLMVASVFFLVGDMASLVWRLLRKPNLGLSRTPNAQKREREYWPCIGNETAGLQCLCIRLPPLSA